VKRLLLISVLLSNLQLLAGTITTNVTALSSFGNVYPFHSSTVLRYTVFGTSLSANLVITADSTFEVSTSYLHGYGKSVTLTPVSGFVDTVSIFVRFSPSFTGSFSGNIVNASVGSTTRNVSVSGTCIAWAIPTSPSNYYATATGRGATLKTNLYNKILGHTAQGYTPGVWNAFSTTDKQLNGKVWDIYSARLDTTSPYEYTLSTDQCGTYAVEGDCYNREHTFPQSWFASGSPMQSDLFHVFASDGKVNGERSNYPFGNVTSVSYTSSYGGKRGTGTTNSGYSGIVFEPIDEYKGDIARAQLYMATRYENLISGWQSNGNANDVLAGNSFPAYDSWYIDLLISWHNLDPVSDKEIKRNNAIFALQANRNPYIDSPHFVQRIWGGSIPNEPTVSASNLSIANHSNTSLTLSWKTGNGSRRIVLVKAGSAVSSFPLDTLMYEANRNLTLAPQIGTGNYVVYNGSGSSVTLTNLNPNTTYHYAIIEYNGWYTTTNYQSSGFLTSSATSLPVSFKSFAVEAIGEQNILLKWETANELNNASFTIQRSTDAITWVDLGKVKGAGTSYQLKRYQWMDDISQQTSSMFIYRLKQTDFDGTFTYSEMRSIQREGNQNPITIKVLANPFTENLQLNIKGMSEQGSYSLFSLTGSLYENNFIQPSPNQSNTVIIDTRLYPPGLYILQLQLEGKQYNYRVVKQ
jgi:endonuclease I